jgi:hypothetical protein
MLTQIPPDSLKVLTGGRGSGWCIVERSNTPDPMTIATATATVKVEIPANLAWVLKNACADGASVWHQNWREVTQGNRTDLDAASCARLSSKCWELWEILRGQGL